jgi:feruloyl-CoA synthase
MTRARSGLLLAPAEVEVSYLADGSLVLRSPHALAAYPATLCERLRSWAEVAPERPFLGERAGAGWRVLGYGEVFAAVRRVGAGLLARGLGPRRPVLLLSDNGVDNALLQLAAMYVGVPAVPVSPAYSLLSQDLVNLRHIAGKVSPGLVYAIDGARFARALAAIARPGLHTVVSGGAAAGQQLFGELSDETGEARADAAHAGTGPDTVAKILFTSGSTGLPKGVLNTQRMLCSNQQAIAQSWPFLAARPPVLVDWLPWHHTFGGNHNFNMALYHGGALYIDDGKPAPGSIERSAENLRMHAPTLYFNVPRGFDVLLPLLEADASLRAALFGAAGPGVLRRGRAAAAPVGPAGGGRAAGPSGRSAAVHGLGVGRDGDLAADHDGALPDRPRGDHRPAGAGLRGQAGAARGQAGDARARAEHHAGLCAGAGADGGGLRRGGLVLHGRRRAPRRPVRPAKGIVFDGRVAEDFKLTSGTWVNVGALRVAALAAAGAVMQDAVVAGEGQVEVGLLVFPNLARVPGAGAGADRGRALAGRPAGAGRAAGGAAALQPRAPGEQPPRRAGRCCCASRRRSTPGRSRTRGTSISGRCSRAARARWRGCTRSRSTRR